MACQCTCNTTMSFLQVSRYIFSGISFSQCYFFICASCHGSHLKTNFLNGGQLIPLPLKVFQGKIIAQFLYGAEIWEWNEKIFSQFVTIQNSFLRKILIIPQGIPTPSPTVTAVPQWNSLSQEVEGGFSDIFGGRIQVGNHVGLK